VHMILLCRLIVLQHCVRCKNEPFFCIFMCSFLISFLSLLVAACNDAVIVGRKDTVNDLCGVVQSTSTMTAPQLLEPFSLSMRSEMVSILRRVTSSGTLATYFQADMCAKS
jgi:hypothetical protein